MGKKFFPKLAILEKRFLSLLYVVRSPCDSWSCCNNIVNLKHTMTNILRMAEKHKGMCQDAELILGPLKPLELQVQTQFAFSSLI